MTTALPEFPDFLRLTYFHGQMLAATDFQREQAYFVEKLRLRNRCLHGYGVACGLEVSSVPVTDRYDTEPDEHQPRVTLHAGVALDCLGNEIVVRRGCPVELLPLLSVEDRRNFHDGDRVYLCVEYCERAAGPTRGVYVDSCGGVADCEYGWRQDSYRIRVTLTSPDNDGCADPCCSPSQDPCLLLARIDGVRKGQAVPADAIHLGVRRPLSRYRFTTITGINWQHGAYYSPEQAAAILGTHDDDGGLRVRFSKDVHTRCLTRGVVDVQVAEGGRGRHADTYLLDGHFEDRTKDEFTHHFRWRQTSGESLQNDDRVLITVRTPFILDRCCRPVDGAHVGGRVPLLPGYEPVHHQPDFCTAPPSGVGPWTSGTGTGAGMFESWFFVKDSSGRDREDKR
ncbi:MAG TPA: hypothetical protein VFW21_08770 [Mycobacterium sp.]|nr:hypothetical protein [Mycobacterium sp.]